MSPADGKTAGGCRWYLYVLRCRDKTLYTGITKNLARRIAQHNKGAASRYTRTRVPVEIIYQERCRTRSTALKKEFAFKQLSRTKKEEFIAKERMPLNS